MSKLIKTSYSIHHQVESFFTGTQIQFEQDEEHFYCAHGSTINKVCVQDGQIKAQIKAGPEEDPVIKFTNSPDDQLLIIAYHSGIITKFRLVDDTIERQFKSLHSAPVSFLKINPSSTLLATGSSDGTIKLWNLVNHYCAHNLKGVNGVITCIEFHEYNLNEELLFCSGGDDNIHVFDVNSSSRIAKLETHCSTVTDMKVISDGTKLISVGKDKIAVIWDICRTKKKGFGSVIRTIPLYESIESLVMIEPQVLKSIIAEVEEARDFFATIGEEGVIKFWDVKTGSKILTQNEPPLSSDRSPGFYSLQLIALSKHNQLCAVSAEKDIFFYDLPNLRLSQQLQGHIDEILSACWFAKSSHLAIACNSKDLKVIEISTSKCQHLKGHKDIVLCVKPVPSDPYCIISSSKDCSALVWKFEPENMSATIIYRATGHTHAIHSLASLLSEKVFFSAGEDTTLKRWSFVERRKVKNTQIVDSSNQSEVSLIANQTVKAHADRVDYIAVSPNDQLVATGSRDKTAKIFSASGLQLIATLKGHKRGIYCVKFSPVDQVIVTAGDSTLRMWNLNDFACVKTFQGHECAVLNFDFFSTGLQILSIGSDGNMKIWNCKTNECMKTIDAHQGTTWTLSLTEDDQLAVTGGQDEKLIIWRDTTREEYEEKLTNLQSQVVQEQDFINYINKKKWRKALKIALKLENQTKTLSVIREILLEPDGFRELEDLLIGCPYDKLNFVIECCVGWSASAKTSSIAQQAFNIVIRNLSSEQLLKMPSLTSSLDQLKNLTEKSFNRHERLLQEAAFVDFFMNTLRIQ